MERESHRVSLGQGAFSLEADRHAIAATLDARLALAADTGEQGAPLTASDHVSLLVVGVVVPVVILVGGWLIYG